MKNEKKVIFPVICILIICILSCGCADVASATGLQNDALRNNPESGIINWIVAMNNHDANTLYELSPEMIKRQISKVEFLEVNTKNPMFIKNVTFVDYTVLNSSQNNNRATLQTQLVMARPDPMTGNISYNLIFYTFNENFENNEWKVWATGFEPYEMNNTK